MKLLATTTLGLEGAVSRELKSLGFRVLDSLSGKVLFEASFRDIPFLNINLRTPERILIFLGSFKAQSFDELYEGMRNLDLSIFPEDPKVFVSRVRSVRSVLHSERAVQSVAMKALVDSLRKVDGSEICPVHVYIRSDEVMVALDTTGERGLHKRGYRLKYSRAPLRETIAASLLVLARYGGDASFHDPFCGSGTIAIEAAMIAANIAPGLSRDFSSSTWKELSKLYEKEKRAAKRRIKEPKRGIVCSDVDEKILAVAAENAERAHVDIKILKADFRNVRKEGWGKMVTNPPYGKRLSGVWKDIGRLFENLPLWEIHMISPFRKIPCPGHRLIKSTPFFNSGVKVYFNQYLPSTPR